MSHGASAPTAPDFRALFEGGPGLYVVLRPDLTIVAASDSYLRATKTERREIVGRHIFEVFPDNPDDLTTSAVASSRTSFERVLTQKQTDVMAVQKHAIRRPQSEGGGFEERYWSPINSPVLGSDGQVTHILHRVEDVTEFVRLKQQGSEQHRARLAAIVDSSDDAIIGKTLDGIVTSWNAGAHRIFGYSAEEIVGKSISLIIPPGHEAEEPTILATVAKGEVKRLETRRRRKDGRDIDVSVTSSPVRDAAGQVIGISKVARDTTDLKHAEKALAQAKDAAQVARRELEVVREREARQRVEGALRESEIRFQRLAESGIIGILTADVEGHVLDANQAYLKMVGYSHEELVKGAVRWSDLTPPELRPLAARAVGQLQASGFAPPWETESLRKDGSRIPMLVGVAMLDPERFIAFAADLTERKRAEAVARSGQARFQALVENSADGIVLSTAAGVLVYVSPAATRMLGRTAAEVLGTNFRAYMHPDDLAETVLHRRHLLEGHGGTPAATRRIVRPDGTFRWLEVTATNLLDNPAIGAVVNNIRDITDRKLAEDALVVAQQRFTALFESGTIGIIVADESGTIHQANDTFLLMVGYTQEDLATGRVNWRKLTPPEWKDRNAQIGDELRQYGRAKPQEKEYFRKDGTRVPVLVGVAVVEGQHMISFSVDLTERKRAAAAIADLEAQFRQAQKIEAIGSLAGGVAHDFNNLLTVILSYGEILLAEMKPDDPLLADIKEILGAGRRAAGLTRQLLMFSRQQAFEPTLVDLNEVITDMEKMIRRLVGEDVELVSRLAASLGKVRVDPSSVEQVIMNLVVNARDAMPVGGRLTIETANVMLDERFGQQHLGVKPGPYVLVAVSDTGAGMDPATQARIFEPFFTTKEMGKGTGLGLSTVFGIVQQSGGSVWVDSELGKGTSLKVYLPLVEGTVQESRLQPVPATLRGTETILLVEDEERVRVVARGILLRQGYRVIEAQNAEEALLLCEKHLGTIDLLLSDVVMPRMSGPALARRLAPSQPTMKILCVSGYTNDAVVRHGAVETGISFMQKPFTPDTLARKVREVLDAR